MKKNSKAKATKKTTAKTTKKAAPAKKLSALNAAAQVLKAAGEPMSAGQMIEAMTEKGLWSSPNGKTPAATLYAAVIREIAKKGSDSRFRKTDRGQFAFNG